MPVPSLKSVTISEYISLRSTSSLENTTTSSNFSSILFVTKERKTNFNVSRKASTPLSHKGSCKTTLWNISYQSRKESNTKGQVLTASSQLSWVLQHSEINCIVEG